MISYSTRKNIKGILIPNGIIKVIEEFFTEIENLKKRPIIIAIDGHSSCGKSTLSKDLAQTLGYRHIDTGAMYRVVTYYFLQNKIDIKDPMQVNDALDQITIDFIVIGDQSHTRLNGWDAEKEIRSLEVSQFVSEVSAISAVRRFLVTQQQQMGKNKAIVMDGRDIGTVVFPEAELKIFMTADIKIRAQRRYEEMIAKGSKDSFQQIQENLAKRDYIDSNRSDSPLKMADDAVIIDSSYLNRSEQLVKAIALAATVNPKL